MGFGRLMVRVTVPAAPRLAPFQKLYEMDAPVRAVADDVRAYVAASGVLESPELIDGVFYPPYPDTLRYQRQEVAESRYVGEIQSVSESTLGILGLTWE